MVDGKQARRLPRNGTTASVRVLAVIVLATTVQTCCALENGLARTPPLGWRSWNAYGGGVTQEKMEAVMEALVDTSRGASLLSLGYEFVGLDDGWQKCGAGINGSFHTASGDPIVDESKFPDMEGMVVKAHSLGLKAGWYLNNCICNERGLTGPIVDLIQRRDVVALRHFGFDGLKLDSCSEWNNLTRWNELINASGTTPILVENCHQGGLDPGSQQWHTYAKSTGGRFVHKLGYLSSGNDAQPVLVNVSLATCEAACVSDVRCAALCFEGADAKPAQPIANCYVKTASAGFVPYDASNGHCHFDGTVGDCPYNFYRTSGDINARWGSMLANIATVVKYLDANTSRPGAWAYPDMLEVGRLANATEDRTHFGLWAIASAPLILGFDAADAKVMDRVWSIVTNREVLHVSQSYAGSAGRRLEQSAEHQTWMKPLGGGRFAVLVLSNASGPIDVPVTLGKIDPLLNATGATVRVRDLYEHMELGWVAGGVWHARALGPHDSRMVSFTLEPPEPPLPCDLLTACATPSTCPTMAAEPPPSFDVVFTTTAGAFTVRTITAWAPPFARRFWQLSQLRYMEGAPFYRVDRLNASTAWVVQFGYRGQPAVDACWDRRQTSNDTWRTHAPGNVRGTVAFSMDAVKANPNCTSPEYCAQGFSTNIFVNYANNSRLDANGFAIFGTVVPPGMEVVDRLFAGYGEVQELCTNASHHPFCVGVGEACDGISMGRLLKEGDAYWRRQKPRLDSVWTVRLVTQSHEREV